MNTKKIINITLVGLVIAICLGLVPVIMEFKNQKMLVESRFQNPTTNQIPIEVINLPTPSPTPVSFPILTIDEILARSREQIPDQTLNLPQNEVTQIILIGDIMLGRSVNFNMHRKKDFSYPVANVAGRLKQADIVIANLEAPILSTCSLTTEGMKLCSDYQSLYTLYYAGIDIAQLANNHIWDSGQIGLDETIKWVEFQGLQVTGLDKAAIKAVRNIKFGFLSYNQISPTKEPIAKATVEKLPQDITQLQNEADVVIVSFHWGEEYRAQPNLEQRRLAKASIDAGADVVFGHHPHWVQGVQIYQGKPIFYSLGNFVFDQMWSKETREGLAVQLSFWQDQLVEVKLLPVFMNDIAQPDWQPVGIGNVTLGKIEKLSQSIPPITD